MEWSQVNETMSFSKSQAKIDQILHGSLGKANTFNIDHPVKSDSDSFSTIWSILK